jgi:hypothetical protein
VVLQATVPAGHWTANRRGTALSFRDSEGALLGGLTQVVLRSRDGVHYRIAITGKNLDLTGSDAPDLLIGLEVAHEAYVSASDCETNGRRTRVRCRQKR